MTVIEPAGHYSPGVDTNHFIGRCDECDAHYVSRMSFERLELAFREGQVGQALFEAYMHLWATSRAHQYSGIGAGWSELPTDPQVLGFVEAIRAANPAATRTSARAAVADIAQQRGNATRGNAAA